MNKIPLLLLYTCCFLVTACNMTPPKNDAAMHITGQYYLAQDGKHTLPAGKVTTLVQYYRTTLPHTEV